MTEENQAAFDNDLLLFGSAFKVDGVRVDPMRVEVGYDVIKIPDDLDISANVDWTAHIRIEPIEPYNVTLTPLEIEYLLFKLGVGVADHGLKPGRGLTGEGAIALRMKLERARG